MTELVNGRSGELIADMTPDEARAMTERIRNSAAATWYLIERAYVEGAWRALGYESWDAYTEGEFRDVNLSIPKEQRADRLGSLRSAGLSTRAISSATGISQTQVRRELGQVSRDGSPDEVLGTDGKSYSATQPEREDPICTECELPLARWKEGDESGWTCTACDETDYLDDEDTSPESTSDDPRVDAETVQVTEAGSTAPVPASEIATPGDEEVTGTTLPVGSPPVTSSVDAVEDYIAELRSEGAWSVEFGKQVRKLTAITVFEPTDVIDRASVEDLDELEEYAARLNGWLDLVRALRPQGLRVINGGMK